MGRPIEVYQYLEPLYNDSRKVRLRTAEGNFEQSHVDEVIDKLIVGDYMFDISLPHIPTRRARRLRPPHPLAQPHSPGTLSGSCTASRRCSPTGAGGPALPPADAAVSAAQPCLSPRPAPCCRWMLEQTNPNLGPWISALDEQFDEEAIAQEADLVAARAAALEDEMAREAAAARCICCAKC